MLLERRLTVKKRSTYTGYASMLIQILQECGERKKTLNTPAGLRGARDEYNHRREPRTKRVFERSKRNIIKVIVRWKD
jgi:hypothetical protein